MVVKHSLGSVNLSQVSSRHKCESVGMNSLKHNFGSTVGADRPYKHICPWVSNSQDWSVISVSSLVMSFSKWSRSLHCQGAFSATVKCEERSLAKTDDQQTKMSPEAVKYSHRCCYIVLIEILTHHASWQETKRRFSLEITSHYHCLDVTAQRNTGGHAGGWNRWKKKLYRNFTQHSTLSCLSNNTNDS